MKVIFSQRAYTGILSETTEKIKTETGGLFLGVYDDDSWYVIEAIDPGPESVFEVAYFEYDQEYTQHLINKVANLYSTKLELIGLWHRHPGSLDVFSSTDDDTNSEYARRNKNGAISALVNIDPDFRLTIYHVSFPCKYMKIDYSVGDDLIPDKYLAFKTPDQYAELMYRRISEKEIQSNSSNTKTINLESFLTEILPGLAKYATNEIFPSSEEKDQKVIDSLLEQLIDDISFMTVEVGVVMIIHTRGNRVVFEQDTSGSTERIYFGYDKETERTIFEYNGNYYEYSSGLFKELFEAASESECIDDEVNIEKAEKSYQVISSVKSFFDYWKKGKP